jgi:hypothetical protein
METVYMGPEQLRTFMADYVKELAADIKDPEAYVSKNN